MSLVAIKVLLVEDSPSDAELLQAMLHRSGEERFQVAVVECLKDALDRLTREPFDVMLLDISLPDSTGLDTFRSAHGAAPHLPIVVLTGVQDESTAVAAIHEGVQDYLVKGHLDAFRTARVIRYAIERKQVEEEREQQARRKDEFLALLGHELRNPLAAISTAMHLLSGGVTAERQDALHEVMNRQVAVLQRLVDDLLDLARIKLGHIELKKEPVDLAELLQRVSAAGSSAIAGRCQGLELRLPAGVVQFMADGIRIEQVVSNLLSNASKYTGPGGRIELSGATEGSEVLIRCKDNGRGIPRSMQRMIFEPFTRVQAAHEVDVAGVGIGLALASRLVELHGGTVSVESAGPGTGSEFIVRLPLVEPPPAPCPATGPVTVHRARRAQQVVIVEDSPDVAQTLEIALEQAGHRVTVFADGPAALSGLADAKPSAVLLDIGLPGMDGYALATKLRQQPHLRDTLFVGISGYRRRELGRGAQDDLDQYLVKPVDLDRLLHVLEAGGRKGRRSSAAKAV